MKSIGRNLGTTALGVLFGGSLMATAALGVAQAEPALPPPVPDGLVNVVVDGATVLDSVPDAQATQAVTGMCALPAPVVNAMVTAVDTAGGTQTACAGRSGGDVALVQNLPPAQEPSPVVPGTSASFESGSAPGPTAPNPIENGLPTEPDNMSTLN